MVGASKKLYHFVNVNYLPLIRKVIFVKGKTQSIAKSIQMEISENITTIFKLKKRGINLIFPDVDKIEKVLLNELNKK